jgi:RNA polymerase sigma-70 factor, ECF subfamily
MKRNSEKFLALITSSQPSLYAYILSLVPNSQQAEDILQETNLVLWRKAGDYTAGTNFLAWACKVAYFNVLSHRRRFCREKLVFSDELLDYLAERQSECIEDLEQRRHALNQCLEKLPDRQRRIIQSRYQPGASVQRMADAAGMTEGALSQFLYRIRGALLHCIQGRLSTEQQR